MGSNGLKRCQFICGLHLYAWVALRKNTCAKNCVPLSLNKGMAPTSEYYPEIIGQQRNFLSRVCVSISQHDIMRKMVTKYSIKVLTNMTQKFKDGRKHMQIICHMRNLYSKYSVIPN